MQRYRAEHPDQAILYLDAGRAFPFKSTESDVVIPRTVQAFEALGLDVLNVGDQDMDGGHSILSAIANGGSFKTISANLVSIDTAKPVFPPYVVLTGRTENGAAGPRVAVVGLTSPERYRVFPAEDGAKLHFLDPLKVADPVIAQARKEADLLVVLGNIGVGPARILATSHPEIDLIIAADERNYDVSDIVFHDVPILVPGILGKYAIRLDVFRSRGPRHWEIRPDMTKLDDGIPVDPEAAHFMKNFQNELEERTRLRADRKKDPRVPDYVGSQACASCHPDASSIWAATKHAKAWETLEANKSTLNPLCLGCHTVGYLKPNGFLDPSTQLELVDVGCESCHGPGGNHVKDPFRSKVDRSDEETCRTCHTSGQTPDFQFAGFWEKIRH